jgi:hypothetical protein
MRAASMEDCSIESAGRSYPDGDGLSDSRSLDAKAELRECITRDAGRFAEWVSLRLSGMILHSTNDSEKWQSHALRVDPCLHDVIFLA